MDKDQLRPDQVDILKEIGNIGMGNATTSLSTMLEERIEMGVPEVSLISLSDVPDAVGGPEKPVAVVFSKALGEASFYIIFLMPEQSALNVIKSLTAGETQGFCSMGRSVIREVGNIVGAAYLNALSFLTNSTFKQTPPILAIDMAGAILGTIFAEADLTDDTLLLIRTTLNTDLKDFEGYLFIVPNWERFKSIVDLLGLELET